MKNNINKIAVIADQNVLQLFPYYLDELYADVPKFVLTVLPGEQNKNIDEAVYLWQNFQEHHIDKKSLIINFGGGKVSDLGGFVASTYQRGIPFINIPTTLLGMIDAAVGGKNGINLNGVKNVVGTFYLPEKIIVDTQFLKTLSPSQLLDGFGEMIKYALIGNGALWNEFIKKENIHAKDIKKEWIDSCIAFKNKIVQEDLYDQGIRHILNFGHTIGHALEAYHMKTPHSGENILTHTISHGHAVALGIIAESYLSFRHNLLPQSTYEEIRNFILQLYQNTLKNISISEINDIVQLCLLDKKNLDGQINITMLEAIGKASPNHWISKEECEEAIRNLIVEAWMR